MPNAASAVPASAAGAASEAMEAEPSLKKRKDVVAGTDNEVAGNEDVSTMEVDGSSAKKDKKKKKKNRDSTQ